jgi:hypothetical protein
MSEKATTVQLAKQPTALRVFAPDFFERADSIFEEISRRAYEIFEGSGRVFGRSALSRAPGYHRKTRDEKKRKEGEDALLRNLCERGHA